MAESKFLKYQDRNRDSLIDICEIDLGPPEQKVCKDCVPNPKALVPNWKTSPPLEPFLNEKICQYQIAITTPATTKTFLFDLPYTLHELAKIKLFLW